MKNSSSKNIAGILLVALGGLWLLGNIGFLNFYFWDYFWPAFFLTVGVVLAVRGKALFIATLFIFFGALNLISEIFYINFNYLFHSYWPLILIALGLLILFKKRNGHHKQNYAGKDNSFSNDGYHSTAGKEGESTGTTADANCCGGTSSSSHFSFASEYVPPSNIDKIDEVAMLTSFRKYITSQNFQGGQIKTILGGGTVDLSGAKLAEGENVIELTAIMGGVTFRIPQDWRVIVNVHSIFGGFEDKRRYFPPSESLSSSVLIIKGTVIMGGGTITY